MAFFIFKANYGGLGTFQDKNVHISFDLWGKA